MCEAPLNLKLGKSTHQIKNRQAVSNFICDKNQSGTLDQLKMCEGKSLSSFDSLHLSKALQFPKGFDSFATQKVLLSQLEDEE